MFNTPVLYKATQDLFFQDVSNDCIVDKMKKEANNQGILPSQSELLSWRANAPKIKELLTMSNVKDAFIVFEYLLPRRLQRIDCMIFGKDYSNRDNVVHIELKQCIIGKTNRDEIQNQMRLKFARKLQKRNVTEKSHTSYSQKWLSNVN